MDDFFTDLDDPLAYAEEMAKHARRVQQKREVKYPARGTQLKRPSAPARPASVKTAKPVSIEPTPQRVQGLPGSEKLQQTNYAFVAPTRAIPAPEKTVLPKAVTARNNPTGDGGIRYLKQRDHDICLAMDDLEWLTTRHLVLIAGSTYNYLPRRLEQGVADEYYQKKTNSLRHPTWRLLERGHKDAGAQLPPVTSDPYDDKHFHRENTNTLMVKLAVGFDEDILYKRAPGEVSPPLPIVPMRWIHESVKSLVANEKDIEPFRYAQLTELINHPAHPREQAWEGNGEMRKGSLPNENHNLTGLYKNLFNAHVFAVPDDDGNPNLAYSPHFVILRPLVEGKRRADGRIENYFFNHDACRVECDPYAKTNYRQLLLDIYFLGMYGRLHEFTNRQEIKWSLEYAWNSLIDDGHLPNLKDKHGKPIRPGHADCFLQIHPLAQPVNNMGKGEDARAADGSLRAKTYASG